MTGQQMERHVPAAGDRQVRGAVRHPGRARRGRAAGLEELGHRVQPRLRGRARHGRVGPVRRGVRHGRRRSRWRTSTCCADRQRADTVGDAGRTRPGRVNLLNWDGKGRPEGLFPPRRRIRRTESVTARADPAAGRRPARRPLLLRYPDRDGPLGRAADPARGARRRCRAGDSPARCGLVADHRGRAPTRAGSAGAVRGDCSTSAAAAACT